ncbi:Gim5p [Ascoidea rubescens DSM 1968]|uniref:Subunit of the heterohexameric cochaperone prefoldin complex which binds specifically to cytosolic c n=1 Tax=Ascoidea rubescens DSM 1968 TaxID=1344418 RepID=A0A1D2VSI9_9ASCO|nr:subunit of the heterohexameric cochaperone prefoldin complex which binds specifically to cytosolic c [Ascoidea rubescens DSM 1968]ODV64571.1 subunit of the heterohexameric cochaperone prefoldin complex which binds specifically to cytosolic c [Ascoidea rubescens DSM 1968]
MATPTTKIDITKLPSEQIIQLKNQVQEELNHFTSSLQALTTAQTKFKDCIDNINEIASSSSSSEKKEIMVPLTGSLYVPGFIKSENKFLCDIGTGYFVEKDSKNAKILFQSKIDKLTKDNEKLTEILQSKADTLNSINNVLRSKFKEQDAAYQAKANK